jgi:hypothetical protein
MNLLVGSVTAEAYFTVSTPMHSEKLGTGVHSTFRNLGSHNNTLRTGDVDLRLYITTVQDGWRKSAFLTSVWFSARSRVLDVITQYMAPVSEWSYWRMFIEAWPHSELMICDKYREQTALYLPLSLHSV